MRATDIHCQHYLVKGTESACALGIDIRATFKPCWPCWTANNAEGRGATCEKFLAFTPEQITESKRKDDAAIERFLRANRAIHEHESASGVLIGQQAQINCPVCGIEKALGFYRTRHRMYVACVTPECVRFEGNYGRCR